LTLFQVWNRKVLYYVFGEDININSKSFG
jgi:hypothetical protein